MARKSKVPTPAELARLYDAGHDALTEALDAGCLPADLQNKWPNLLGTLRRVEGQPYHRPGLNGREDPLTDDEKRVLAWEFRKAAQRAEEALKKCRGRAANPTPRELDDFWFSPLRAGDRVQFRWEPGTGGVIKKITAGEALVATPRGDRRILVSDLRRARPRRNPAPWAKVFG